MAEVWRVFWGDGGAGGAEVTMLDESGSCCCCVRWMGEERDGYMV